MLLVGAMVEYEQAEISFIIIVATNATFAFKCRHCLSFGSDERRR